MDMTLEGGRIARDADRRAGEQRNAEFLAYRLGAEEYGVDIRTVQEIRSYEPPTRVPQSPHYLKGVVNLRGVIVPIMDLRLKLGTAAEYTPATVVIVLSIHGKVAGVVVDAVSDVLSLPAGEIKPPPEMSSLADGFVTGIAAVGERMLLIADLDALFTDILGVSA